MSGVTIKDRMRKKYDVKCSIVVAPILSMREKDWWDHGMRIEETDAVTTVIKMKGMDGNNLK